MYKHLVIVESPAKARTIEKYLGKEYQVVSSYGHIRDLPKNNKAIDIDNNFSPTYEVNPDKKHIITQLKKNVKVAEYIYLASDDDREGEAIAWHLKEALNINHTKTKRIVFREITKKAILQAIKNPRHIDQQLVDSQQARRILDRLVGFELSPMLWKKIKTGLSAGRVQSVAVRLVVEKERAILQFKVSVAHKVTALFLLVDKKQLNAVLNEKIKTSEEVKIFLEKCKKATYIIQNLEKKQTKRSSSPPFTTSTLQQEASRKLGYAVAYTMSLAQKLYEAGKISYMRTDAVYLSEEAIQSAKAMIKDSYGDHYVRTKNYKTKSTAAQEAHEAIRPTDFSVKKVSTDLAQQRLYTLIWKRAIASQMAEAKIEKTTATIAISTVEQKLIAQGEVIQFDGFLRVYQNNEDGEDDEQKNMLPPLTVGQVLDLDYLQAKETFTKPPARFTEAALVKELEERGIGRPSTYAPIISTIQKRNYVIKESREGKERLYNVYLLQKDKIITKKDKAITGIEKKKLFPTDTAMIVNDFLVNHFSDITNYQFTAEIEKKLDEIAQGKNIWHVMLANFYQSFHTQIKKTAQIERNNIPTSRVLGQDPKTGKNIIVRLGKYGPVVQIGDAEEKPRYAKLSKDQFLESITLEEALILLQLPRNIGKFENLPMVVDIGRFGPYIKHNNFFFSIPKEENPYTLSLEQAIVIIENKRKFDAEKHIKSFEENKNIQILNGRWGPYIKAEKKNIRIPKTTDPKSLTLKDCLNLIATSAEKKIKKKK